MGSAQLLTYKQAIKYPVGTVFKYTGDTRGLLVVRVDDTLMHLMAPITGNFVGRHWDNDTPDLELYTSPKEPTVAEVCAERGWAGRDDGTGSFYMNPGCRRYLGGLPASKVARIIDIIEEE